MFKLAALLHFVRWDIKETNSVVLEDGIYFKDIRGTKIEELYKTQCNNSAIDDGEPLGYNTALVIDSHPDRLFDFFGSHECIVTQISNIWAIVTAIPVGTCRIFGSSDDFKTAHYTESLFPFSDYHVCLENRKDSSASKLTLSVFERMKICWHSFKTIVPSGDKNNTSIFNAFCFFIYAWRAFFPDHACINLAIILESLFSPSDSQELSHRIAYNSSYFLGSEGGSRQIIYHNIRKYYKLRSIIVHGGTPNYDQLYELTPVIFDYCARILYRLLVEDKYKAIFNNRDKREKLFQKWLFR